MVALYSNRMHDFVLRELELGPRAARFEDSEAAGWSALDDISYAQYAAPLDRARSRDLGF